MTERVLLPQFIREALEAEPAEESAALGALLSLESALGATSSAAAPASLAGTRTPSAGLLERLELTLSEPPHRYAPFFSQAAQLFDLPEEALVAQLARLRDPNTWTFAGLPGIAKLRVEAGPALRDAETLLVRFNPGVRFPLHRHTGIERVLVLEGSYEDSNGVLHRAGELREWPSDTEHSFRVGDEVCIFASVVHGRRFSSWPLRALESVLGR